MPKKVDGFPGRIRARSGGGARPHRPARAGPKALPRPAATIPIGTNASSVPAASPISSPSRAPTPPRVAGTTVRPARASNLPLITDYHYVYDDLRRIGVLAGIAFAVLIGLTFVVR